MKGFTGGIITGFVFCNFLFIGFLFILLNNDLNIPLILICITCFCFTIWMGYILIKTLKQPKLILEYDDHHLYYNEYKKITKIELKSIIDLKKIYYSNKHKIYEFGSIHIVTKDGRKFTIGMIYDMDKAYKTIVGAIYNLNSVKKSFFNKMNLLIF